jgi:hypothetical protein
MKQSVGRRRSAMWNQAPTVHILPETIICR